MRSKPASKAEALQAFATTYGKLCRLAAHALSEGGYHRQAVYLATIGQNQARDRVLTNIHSQRLIVEMAISTAHEVGVDSRAIVEQGRDTKRLIESEWLLTIPLQSVSV
jgi:hypothetical protein